MENITLTNKYLNLDPIFFTKVTPTPLKNPFMISYNTNLAKDIRIDLKTLDTKEFIDFINGNYLLKGSAPYAKAYSGHQFGYFVPNLGDGRAINYGKFNAYHLQTKGSGITAYSRDGDGKAVLRSSIREYLLSEAMAGLGIPTSRALAIIGSKTKAYRNYEHEDCAIVLRASTSWIRFGSFEFAYTQNNKDKLLKQLANYVIEESYPHLIDTNNKYEEFYFTVVDKTIELMALWQSVGFMHGVMNTDNMSIAGLTIDYGPYAMMEEFDKSFICNLSDKEGRYSFENQPFIAQWNLSVLAKVLSPIANEKLMNSYNDTFIGRFKKKYFELMAKKIGLYKYNYEKDGQLIVKMFKAMQEDKIDYTSFFYSLSTDTIDLDGKNINKWLNEYYKRLESEPISKKERLNNMRKTNPKYILRNYMIQDAIDKAQNGDFTLVNDFLKIAHDPFGEFPKYEHYTRPKPNWEALKCSCSS